MSTAVRYKGEAPKYLRLGDTEYAGKPEVQDGNDAEYQNYADWNEGEDQNYADWNEVEENFEENY